MKNILITFLLFFTSQFNSWAQEETYEVKEVVYKYETKIHGINNPESAKPMIDILRNYFNENIDFSTKYNVFNFSSTRLFDEDEFIFFMEENGFMVMYFVEYSEYYIVEDENK